MSRPVLIALAGVVVLVIAIGMSIWGFRRDNQPPTPTEAATTSTATPPSFDIVRISQHGETVIAGRAQPRAEVVILDNGHEIGRVIADNRGEWVFVPDHPLPPGSRELTLQASNPDGSKGQTESPVILVVPDYTKDKNTSLAVKIRPDGSIDILQGPESEAGSGPVAIAGVRYDSRDRLSVAGRAPEKARINVYVDEKPVASTRADAQGHWRVAPKVSLHSGSHTVRADLLDEQGKVTARAEVTFTPTGALPADGKITVEPGNSLWRIARMAYGSGFEYLTIYQANKAQIRDPNLIYPGQVIQVPNPG